MQTQSIAILGVSGRLGRAILLESLLYDNFKLSGAVVRAGSDWNGIDLGQAAGIDPVGIKATVSIEEACETADIVIDASQPDLTVIAAQRLARMPGKAFVTGVTGLDGEQERLLRAASGTLPILRAGNFSIGVAIMEALVAKAASLPAQDWDVEIEEAHHRMKVDAPSGTALMLGEAVARARQLDFDQVKHSGRDGQTGQRPAGVIGFSATRGGGIVGEHAVRFISELEEISIQHRAFDRRIFARGALIAAGWMAGREAGLYSMQDVVADV